MKTEQKIIRNTTQTVIMKSTNDGIVRRRVINYENTDLQKFLAGAKIDAVMPYLNKFDRAFLLTGQEFDERTEPRGIDKTAIFS